jgi:hypothetical protein
MCSNGNQCIPNGKIPKTIIFYFKRRFGMALKTALSMDKDCGPLEKVNVLSSTLVR